MLCFMACAKKPNDQELNRLESARIAAEAAESKLDAIKKERMALEEELAIKKKNRQEKQNELDKAKVNSGN